MSGLKNLSIASKLGLLAGLPLLVLLFVAVYSYLSSSSVNRQFIYAYENYSQQAMNMNQARSNIQGSQKDILKSVLTTDEDYLKEIDADFMRRRKENSELFSNYEKTQLDENERRLLNRINESRERFLSAQDDCIQLGEQNLVGDATASFFDTLDPVATEYNAAVVELSQYLVKQAEKHQFDAIEKARRTALASAGITLVSAVLVVLLSVLVVRLITKPLGVMKGKIELFSEGDLQLDFSDDGRDAISQMSNALQNMVGTLRGVVRSINDASDHISGSSQDFSAMAEESSAAASEFRNNVGEMAANLDRLAAASQEVNASVEEVAAGAQTTAEKGTNIARKVEEAMTAGDKGIEAVRSVVKGISGVAETSATATGAVTQLGDRARQIQGFVAQIGGIADQTNLLALNAAIEAARAGEAGRGFAVVAEEVRKLAEDSNVAAKSIADLAGTITSEIDSIVGIVQENARASGTARDLSSQTEGEINKMIDSLHEIAGATQDLAAVAQEQAASSEEIAEAVQSMSKTIGDTARAGENIRDGVGEVATSSEGVAKGAEQLAGLSNNLREELAFFKTDSEIARAPMKALPGTRGR